MKRQALENLRSAIEANTKRMSLDQLKAQGKRHVRIVSGDKVMRIIKAVVADIVDREVGEISERDRERIINRTKQEFDRVLKIQSDQEALVQEQKELVKEYRHKFERLSVTVREADKRIEQLREDLVARDLELERVRTERDTLATRASEDAKRLEQIQEALRAKELELERLHGEQESSSKRATKRSAEFEQLRESVVARDLEAKRLQRELETRTQRSQEDAERLEQAQEALRTRDLELERVRGEREALSKELEAVRAAVHDSGAFSIRDELAAMREYLTSMEERTSAQEEATINALLQKLESQSSTDTRQLEERFSGTLDSALDKITRTMAAATARPIDIVVEATDVLVDKLFDEETEMSTNLDRLEVDEKSSKSDISRNLAALKKLRAASGGPPAAKAEEDEKEEPSRGPDAESSAVSAKERKRVSASVDRLKAVRGKAKPDEK